MSAPSQPSYPASRRPLLAAFLLVLLAGVLGSSAWSASAAPLSLTSGITAYWPLDEVNGNRTDLAAGLVLTDTNTVTQAGGKLGYAAQFTASNLEYLAIADNATISTGDIHFTFSAWVWLDSRRTQFILSQSDGATTVAHRLRYNLATDNFVWQVWNGATGLIGNVEATSFGSPPLEQWLNVIAWHDATANEIGVCVNLQCNTAATSGAAGDSTAPFRLGIQVPSSAESWDGRIDSVGFWKRVLTSDERARLWNGGAGCDYPFADCEAVTLTATPTHTPGGPTATPAYLTVASLDSGDQLWIERRWTWGELFTGLAVVALAAILALRWVYDVVIRELHQEARRD